MDNWKEKFEYIMNDDYWLARWTIFLMKQLIDQIYNDKAKQLFSLN